MNFERQKPVLRQNLEESFGKRPFQLRYGPKPDSNSRGTRKIATIGVASDEPRPSTMPACFRTMPRSLNSTLAISRQSATERC